MNPGLYVFVDREKLRRQLLPLAAQDNALARKRNHFGLVSDLDLHAKPLALGKMITMPADQNAGRAPIHQWIVAAVDPHRSRRGYPALSVVFLN